MTVKFKPGQLVLWTFDDRPQYLALIKDVKSDGCLNIIVLIAYNGLWVDTIGSTRCFGIPDNNDLEIIQ